MVEMPWWVGLLFLIAIIVQAQLMSKAFEAHKKMAIAYREILADYFRELDKRAPEHQLGQPSAMWLSAESLRTHADEMRRDLSGEEL